MPDVCLFQYGSNMTEAALAAKIEKHARRYAPPGTPTGIVPRGSARAPGQRLTLGLFSAQLSGRVADMVETDGPDKEVWGILYKLSPELVVRSDGGRSVLDRIEGHRTERDPENYRPVQVRVETQNGPVEAWTYVGSQEARARCAREHGSARVSAEYARALRAGAASAGLPASYRAELEALLARHT